MGPVDAERLRRYTFVSERGLTLYESGVGALEMFLTARLFMYQHVYLHRTVRAIDLDLDEVFAPSILAVFGDGSPAERLGRVRRPRRVRAAPPGRAAGRAASASRPRRSPGDGTVTPGRRRRLAGDPAPPAALARRARGPRRVRDRRLARRPARRAGRAEEPGAWSLDLTGIDARPGADRSRRRSRSSAATAARARRSPRRCRRLPGVAADRPAVPPGGLTARAARRAARTSPRRDPAPPIKAP